MTIKKTAAKLRTRRRQVTDGDRNVPHTRVSSQSPKCACHEYFSLHVTAANDTCSETDFAPVRLADLDGSGAVVSVRSRRVGFMTCGCPKERRLITGQAVGADHAHQGHIRVSAAKLSRLASFLRWTAQAESADTCNAKSRPWKGGFS